MKSNKNPGDFLPLNTVLAFEPLAQKKKVSSVARGPEGFLRQYEDVSGNPEALRSMPVRVEKTGGQTWMQKRNGFVARHMAQINNRGEPLWDKKGNPTRRHLALIMWAYTPDPEGVFRWVEDNT